MSSKQALRAESPGSYKSLTVTFICGVIVSVCLTWMFLGMRSVMGVGGACASGGAYEIATPCPDGSWLIAVAAPVMLLTAFTGSGFAMSVGGPNMIVPMWGVLFGSLGWNFLEFGLFGGDVVWGWLVCGVMFWAMAAPAWWWMGQALVSSARGASRPAPDAKRWSASSLGGSLWWWAVYLLLGAAGFVLGAGIYHAAAT